MLIKCYMEIMSSSEDRVLDEISRVMDVPEQQHGVDVALRSDAAHEVEVTYVKTAVRSRGESHGSQQASVLGRAVALVTTRERAL